MKILRGFNIALAFFAFAFVFVNDAPAAFNISVTPYEGGYDLRFGKVSSVGPCINKEVIVNITSDIGKQYHLVQRLLEPLTNAQGISLAQNNFYVYAIRGVNKYGTLGVEQEIPVFLGRTIIYTSNSQGLSDSFNLVYSLKGSFNVPAGSYRGRIAFTLEPIGAAQEQVTVILNIFAEIEIESSIEIKTITGSKIISLSSEKEETLSFDVLVDVKGGLGSLFKILQLLPQPLKSPEGEELPCEAVNFLVREAKKGSGLTQLTPLSSGREVIYVSGPGGEPESFVITYSLGDLSNYKAGRYRTNIQYLLEQTIPAQINPIDTYGLEVEIERAFDIIIKTELGGGIIEFRDLKPREPPKIYEVTIEVETNIGKRYQVSQNVLSELVNKEGRIIPQKNFTLRTESVDTKGMLKSPQKAEVKKGDTVLFVSDKEGSADSFKIIYELTVPSNVRAGDYSTSVVYSLSEI